MAFDGERFVERFNTVWNGHDLDGILGMMTDDVVFEASFGKDPWGTRVVGKPAVREFLQGMFARIPDVRWDEIRHFACPELAVVEWLTSGSPRGGARSRWRAATSSRSGTARSPRSARTARAWCSATAVDLGRGVTD
jgi:ketosteroid isomerase-like protein